MRDYDEEAIQHAKKAKELREQADDAEKANRLDDAKALNREADLSRDAAILALECAKRGLR